MKGGSPVAMMATVLAKNSQKGFATAVGRPSGSPSKMCLKLVEVPGGWKLSTPEHRGAPVREPETLELLGVTSVEVVCSEIAIGRLIFEHVEHDDQNCVTHGHNGALFAFARG